MSRYYSQPAERPILPAQAPQSSKGRKLSMTRLGSNEPQKQGTNYTTNGNIDQLLKEFRKELDSIKSMDILHSNATQAQSANLSHAPQSSTFFSEGATNNVSVNSSFPVTKTSLQNPSFRNNSVNPSAQNISNLNYNLVSNPITSSSSTLGQISSNDKSLPPKSQIVQQNNSNVTQQYGFQPTQHLSEPSKNFSQFYTNDKGESKRSFGNVSTLSSNISQNAFANGYGFPNTQSTSNVQSTFISNNQNTNEPSKTQGATNQFINDEMQNIFKSRIDFPSKEYLKQDITSNQLFSNETISSKINSPYTTTDDIMHQFTSPSSGISLFQPEQYTKEDILRRKQVNQILGMPDETPLRTPNFKALIGNGSTKKDINQLLNSIRKNNLQTDPQDRLKLQFGKTEENDSVLKNDLINHDNILSQSTQKKFNELKQRDKININPTNDISQLRIENMQLRSEVATLNSKVNSLEARLDGIQQNLESLIHLLFDQQEK